MTERPYGVPRFAMLDIWMSLGGDSQDFEDWANDPNRFPADAWAQLCAAVASNVDALEADTNPPAGDTLLALAKRRAEIDALRSELEAMRPVVEAAKAWRADKSMDMGRVMRLTDTLFTAVDDLAARSVRNGE